MGAPDQLAKEVFAEEVPRLFGDKVTWQTGTELSLTEVRLDGVLGVRMPLDLSALPAPWSLLGPRITAVEVKMPGDHVTWVALQRALLRRQALQVALAELTPPHETLAGLWLVAPHLPKLVRERGRPEVVASGCYRLGLGEFETLWVAANELPLHESLWPFLVARSGLPLVEMLRWAIGRQPAGWVSRVLQTVSLTKEQETMLKQDLREYAHLDNPEAHERLRNILEVMVETMAPELRAQFAGEGAREAARAGEVGKIETACELLGIEVTEARRAQLAALDLAGLGAFLSSLKAARAWPAG